MYVIYSRSQPHCPYCENAKRLLKSRLIEFEERDIATDLDAKAFLINSGFKTVPQVFDGDKHVGGFDALKEYLKK